MEDMKWLGVGDNFSLVPFEESVVYGVRLDGGDGSAHDVQEHVDQLLSVGGTYGVVFPVWAGRTGATQISFDVVDQRRVDKKQGLGGVVALDDIGKVVMFYLHGDQAGMEIFKCQNCFNPLPYILGSELGTVPDDKPPVVVGKSLEGSLFREDEKKSCPFYVIGFMLYPL